MTNPFHIRHLLNTLEQLNESPLKVGDFYKPERFVNLINNIKTGKPLYLDKDGSPVLIKKSEADRLQAMWDSDTFKGSVKLTDVNGAVWALSQFRKTVEYGGASPIPGEEPAAGGQHKESIQVKPSQIGITDKNIPATALEREIIRNSVLQGTEYGQIVIKIAQDIVNGVPPSIGKDAVKTMGAGTLKAIVDYAGEYLGVLALVKDQSTFPKRAEFLEWLGGDIDSLILNFPSKSNTPLADSFASIVDPDTNRQINISSKGTGGGAAPSLSSITIPEHIRKKKEFQTVIDIIDLTQNPNLPSPSSVSQVFLAMNRMYEDPKLKKKIPAEFNKFLPWDKSIVTEVKDSLANFKRDSSAGKMPRYQSLVDMQSGAGSDGGKLVYLTKKTVMDIVNNEMPEFQSAILEILDYNFIQQYADIEKKTGTFKFHTQWPAKLDGIVTMESKSSTTDPTQGGFSFKLGPSSAKAYVPDEAESAAQEKEQDDAVAQKIADIAAGKSTMRKSRPSDTSEPRQRR